MSLCELDWLRRDLDAAENWAREALDFATRAAEKANIAQAHVWLGRIAEAGGHVRRADSEFNAAFEALTDQASTQHAIQAHAVYAEILESRGDLAGAVQHLKQALATGGADWVRDSRAATA